MRAALKSWGVEVRRFPVWLQIFNILCGLTMLLIAGSGIYFVVLGEASEQSLLSEGRLDHEYLIAELNEGHRKDLALRLKALPSLVRDNLIIEFGALCEPLIGALLLECAEQDVARDRSLEVFERWRQAFKADVSMPEGAEAFETWIRGLDRKIARRKLAAEAIIFGASLARRLAVEKIAQGKDRELAWLFICAARAPFRERETRELALSCLETWYGPVSENRSWQEVIASYRSKAGEVPKKFLDSRSRRLETLLKSDQFEDRRRALRALALLGLPLPKKTQQAFFSHDKGLQAAAMRVVLLSQSKVGVSKLWQNLKGNALFAVLLMACEFPNSRPPAPWLKRLREEFPKELWPREGVEALRGALMLATLSWSSGVTEKMLTKYLVVKECPKGEAQVVLRGLGRAPRAIATRILTNYSHQGHEELRSLALEELEKMNRRYPKRSRGE